ncbi:hypothetical protein L6452_09365 [Arctium lappa]|uniref:Uncharacterized protein n=1 Tax=Arctium lappa TaxID=4217 RepID=A0ACB9DKB7_ARCLA|nr:hypothetical protein L6452_09365 [Arctium lappa]
MDREEAVNKVGSDETKVVVVQKEIKRTKTKKRKGSEQQQEEPHDEEQLNPQMITRKKQKLTQEGTSTTLKPKHLFSSSMAKNNCYAFATKTGTDMEKKNLVRLMRLNSKPTPSTVIEDLKYEILKAMDEQTALIKISMVKKSKNIMKKVDKLQREVELMKKERVQWAKYKEKKEMVSG